MYIKTWIAVLATRPLSWYLAYSFLVPSLCILWNYFPTWKDFVVLKFEFWMVFAHLLAVSSKNDKEDSNPRPLGYVACSLPLCIPDIESYIFAATSAQGLLF